MDNSIILILILALLSFFAIVIFEIILYRNPYRKIMEEIREKVLKVKPAEYNFFLNTIEKLPKEILIVEHIEQLKEEFSSLGHSLRSKTQPFFAWGQRFHVISEKLGEFLPLDSSLRLILKNPTLEIEHHFNADLTTDLDKLKSSILDKDEAHCEVSISELQDTINSYVNLTKDWIELRNIASRGIDIVKKGEEIWKDWGWLRHGLDNIFEDPKKNKGYVWYPWNILSRPNLLVKLTNWIAFEIESRGWRYDTICALSSSGLLVATLLSIRLKTDLLAVDDIRFFSLPRDRVGHREQILLVDSGVQTGMHLKKVTEKLQEDGAAVVGAVCICINNLLPKEKKRLSIVDEMLNRRKIIYLYELSDLYNLWKKGRWEIEKNES